MEDIQDSLVDFFSILTSVIQDSPELFESSLSQEKIASGLLNLVQSRCSINSLDFNLNEKNSYSSILNKVPDILDLKEAISTGCIDQDDLDIVMRFFDVIIEMCKPSNIILIINSNTQNKNCEDESNSPKISDSKNFDSRNTSNKKSLFPMFVKTVIESITRFVHNANIRSLLFHICINIVNTLIECDWNDDNILTWFSRPALSDLLIIIACNENASTDISDINDINYFKKNKSCNSCYVKYIVLSSILTKLVEVFKKLHDPNFNDISTIYIIDNLALCFSISFYVITYYHPTCYSYQVNSTESKNFKNWWSLKSELFNIIQLSKLNLNNVRYSNVIQVSTFFFNKLDSSHLSLKKMSTKSHLMKNSAIHKHHLNSYFSNEALYENIKVDLPTSLYSMIFYLDKIT